MITSGQIINQVQPHFRRVWLPTQFNLAVPNLGITGGTDVHKAHR